MRDGFIKVAAASPVIKVADTDYNADKVIESIKAAAKAGVKVLTFPELTLTGCTCYDIVGHRVILEGAKKALKKVMAASEGIDMLVFVGLPCAVGAKLLSCAAVLYSGELIGFVPRENVRGSHFVKPDSAPRELELDDSCSACLSADMLFVNPAIPGLAVSAELGADINAVSPPSVRHALAGASLIVQLASFPGTVSSTDEAELRLREQSSRLCCGIIMAAPGKGESTTDNTYTGFCAVAENGELLAQSEGENSLAISEVDIECLMNKRRDDGGFDTEDCTHYESVWGGKVEETVLTRAIYKYPILPKDPAQLPQYCRRMLDIQVSGLVKRMEFAKLDHCVVGISGGVDSTLAVLVSSMAVERMGLPSANVIACTMPCFGTSSRTKSNAIIVAEQLGAEVRVIDIGHAVYQHFDDIGHAYDDYSVAFENSQARERTQVLMDIANKENGLDVGTEDLSEFVDGWCTFNGDHISMYDVNLGLTKTQVRAAVRYIADTNEDKVLVAALMDVLDCPVTPELLPIHDDTIEQKSEDSVGSYSLQDFFTYCMLICGFGPAKALRLAKIAYRKDFSDSELIHWLKSYCIRLFSQQFKRSCLMDGPAVTNFTVSPRIGLKLPSDGECALFLREAESLK